jgi:hypothetical protein
MSEGLIKGILDKTPLGGLGLQPSLTQQDIVIEMTEKQLRDMLLTNADTRARDSVSVELHEGKLVLKIKLF